MEMDPDTGTWVPSRALKCDSKKEGWRKKIGQAMTKKFPEAPQKKN